MNNQKIKLWTRQNKKILDDINNNNLYIVKEEYLKEKLGDITSFYIKTYNWYNKKANEIVKKPDYVRFPIWLSMSNDIMLQPTRDTVILELEVDKDLVIEIDPEKWGKIVNYFYVPLDKDDELNHEKELLKIGINDESALFMSSKGNFYPLMKRKIEKSWDRLFDYSYSLSTIKHATLWEIKKEWIVKIYDYNGDE
ncbi:MAG: DUF3841 domain-containing protein [Peptostreptococcaceae bacterium]|nr:DUF3841 domain-containing protein [Peptostreptococcaceae bacterium]